MTITHRTGSYDITFQDVGVALADARPQDVIVTDENLDRYYRSAFPGDTLVVVVAPGEPSKSLATYEAVCNQMFAAGRSRSSRVYAFGGGVVGDLAGFVAATYMRGVPCIQCPTSLLAMVDSSIGGKVGIDTEYGKNLLGAFAPPAAVRIPLDSIGTLPDREFVNGTAEVWKYGFIGNQGLLTRLQKSPVRGSDDDLQEVVESCLAQKAAVVEADEFETTGLRATLNFGHTVGHAIEAVAGYGAILHGEAISIGMVVETQIAEATGIALRGLASIVEEGLRSQGLPTAIPSQVDATELIASMRRDKKATAGKLAFSLLTDLTVCKLYEDVPEDEVRRVLGC